LPLVLINSSFITLYRLKEMKKIQHLLFSICVLVLNTSLFAQNSNITVRSTMEWPGQTLANICGYTAPDGKEYALVGGSKGMIIVDISNPDVPVQIVQIPGPDNLWKEIKVYQNFAYCTSEGGGGCQIIDLSALPSATLPFHSYTGDGVINGQLSSIHALHIDTKKGFLYLFGSNLFGGSGVVCDLNTDPYNPVYAGKYNQNGYIHDGYADNDTLYAAHINSGQMIMVDMANKANPMVLGSVETPARFTHNVWLTDDHKSALTTDETGPSFLTSYDITDPTDIIELDRFQTTPGSGSIGHNTHIRNDWAITSWYRDGFNIVDAHRPSNLVQTATYDTWPSQSGEGFDGCWGVFPFFPSGTIVASNIENAAKMFVCTPEYKRACYLEGSVTDGCTNLPLSNALIAIVGGDPLSGDKTNTQGVFKTGQVTPGTFNVVISKSGYISKTVSVALGTAEVTNLNVVLEPTSAYSVTGTVVNQVTGQVLPNAQVVLANANSIYSFVTDANGSFNADCVLGGTYSAIAGVWGYKLSQDVQVSANTSVTLTLEPGYYDDFALDYNWTNTTTASTGAWVREVPVGTDYNGAACNTGVDANGDGNDICFITGNGGDGAGTDDVDNGIVTLTSPVMNLAAWPNAKVNFQYWFYNGGGNGGAPDDKLEVTVSNGTQTVNILTQSVPLSSWRASGDILLGNLLPLTNTMTVSFKTGDTQAAGHLVEAAVDIFEVTPAPAASNTNNIDQSISINIAPNPTNNDFKVNYSFETVSDARIVVSDILGKIVETRVINTNNGVETLGAALTKGVYFVTIEKEGKRSQAVKVMKM
jgi:choice-of-anchor B domain-containing protein